jgi:hypothetical protein
MPSSAKKRIRKSPGSVTVPIAMTKDVVDLLDRVLDEEREHNPRLTKAALVRFLIRAAIQDGRRPPRIP